MSLLYSFVTPLTSMVVTKPESDDSPMIADKLTEGGRGLRKDFWKANLLPAVIFFKISHFHKVRKNVFFLSAVQQRNDNKLNELGVRKLV